MKAKTENLDRLLQPDTIAVIGGGAWCSSVIKRCLELGYTGQIWPVHPKKTEIEGLRAYASVDELPAAPDSSFVGVNKYQTIEVIKALSARGAGGAVCFAAGFKEAQQETGDGLELQEQLLEAAGEMRIMGPNCYGFLNFLDGVLLWPDIHGGKRVEKGVALISQSSNLAINLTMQQRGLPVAYVVTTGNQAQTSLSEIGEKLLEDDRVTALGLYIEGIGDLQAFEAMALKARKMGKGIVAVKSGRSEQSQAGVVSHTASLAGSAAGSDALLKRLGIGQVLSPSDLLETLKILHFAGPLKNNQLVSLSCSGGEASLIADNAVDRDVTLPPLNDQQKVKLANALGEHVFLANPLDYHTFIWARPEALHQCFMAAFEDSEAAIGFVVLDFPRSDRCGIAEWEMVVDALSEVRQATGKTLGVLSSMPENLSEDVAETILSRGLIPLAGITESLVAIETAAFIHEAAQETPLPLLPLRTLSDNQRTISESEAKDLLRRSGLSIPQSVQASSLDQASRDIDRLSYPLVLKAVGLAHKTEAGGVILNIQSRQELEQAVSSLPTRDFLVEEMVEKPVAELLVGLLHDPACGYLLTLGAGGVMTELWQDTRTVLLPATRDEILRELEQLRVFPLLKGYRGMQAANMDAVLDAIDRMQTFVISFNEAGNNNENITELEINPLLCTATSATAVDALMRTGALTDDH
ncbi:acetate--CoA ligase family protein [Kiloniella sp. b19]|uniref:acetate--CoA ligase family protein n=1 Tax=Kiloniella sp. GXU_MW_B19 TaxID=3141326 RepID=UPI0031D9CFDA